MWTIARLTYREMLSRRVFHLALLLTFLFLLLYGTGLYFAYKDPVSDVLMRNIMATQLASIGLYLSTFIVAFLTVLGSIGAVSGDVESGIIQTILVKPLRRWEIILGKVIGLALMLMIYSCFFFFVVLGLNMFFGKGIVVIYPVSIMRALCYYISLPVILTSLSLWGSTFLSTLNNGIMVVMLYSLATIGGLLEQLGRLIEKEALVNIGIISSLILPVDAIYRKMVNTLLTAPSGDMTIMFWDSIFTGKYEPSKWMLVYTAAYIVFFLWQGIRVFTRRDI